MNSNKKGMAVEQVITPVEGGGLGAFEFVTDLKNNVFEYVAKSTKFVAAESKYLAYSKGLGTIAGVAGTAYSGYKILDAKIKGQEADFWDKLDFGVGLTGTLATGVLMSGMVLNPIGITILGVTTIGATVYGGARVGMELYKYYKKP